MMGGGGAISGSGSGCIFQEERKVMIRMGTRCGLKGAQEFYTLFK